MKKIIISAVAAAVTAGTLLAAPPAFAEPRDGPFPGPFQFPDDFPYLKGDPTYEPVGVGLGVPEVRGVHSSYQGPASNPSA